MEIRSPANVGFSYGLPVPVQQPGGANTRERPPADKVDELESARQRARERPAEYVIQGEVIERERPENRKASTTNDFLRGRVFDAQDFNGRQQQRTRRNAGEADISSANQQALGAYLSHRRETIDPNANRGQSVDYFI